MEVAHLYKITNKINGNYYIGKHNGWKQNGYWGSGLRIKSSVEKYGEENFSYDILCYGSPEYILKLEERYVTLELIESDKNCLNLMGGGLGVGRATEETRKKLSLVALGENNPMFGKKQSEQTKLKISNSLKGKLLKSETKKILSDIFSEKIWINDKIKNKRISKNELEKYLKKGFELGRTNFSHDLKEKISKGISKLIWVNNGEKSCRIGEKDIEKYLKNGYAKGRGKINFKKGMTNG